MSRKCIVAMKITNNLINGEHNHDALVVKP